MRSCSLLMTLALLLGGADAPAQSATWTRQQGPTTHQISDVVLLSPTEAWMTAGGTLWHTLDAGLTWIPNPLLPPTGRLDALFFLDQQRGWVAGHGVFYTTDGGATWTRSSTVTSSLYGLFFVDATHGWATASGDIYRSQDGGQTWTRVTLPVSGTCHGVYFLDRNRGWVSNINGVVFRTNDGGASWVVDHRRSNNLNLNKIWFASPSEGFIVGSREVHYTADGGQTWQFRPLPQGFWGFEAFFLDRFRAWAVGQGGAIVSTNDGWLTATVHRTMGAGPTLTAVGFAGADVGMAAGEHGNLLLTGDGGRTWMQRNSGGEDVYGIDANDPAHAWVSLFGGRIARTTNGGAQWLTEPVPGFTEFGYIHDVDFLDDNLTGWVAGADNAFGGTSGIISHSTDGGRTWTLQHTLTGVTLYSVVAVDRNTALACGLVPRAPDPIVRTVDGGRTWQTVLSGQGVFFDLDFPDPMHGWAAGAFIFVTTDGGTTWQHQFTPPTDLEDIDMVDTRVGWAVGRQGLVYRTLDGGRTWTRIQNPLFGNGTIGSVSAIDANTAWIAGHGGLLARTTNGGLTWTTESVSPGTSTSSFGYQGLAFLDADYGWVGTAGADVVNGPWHRQAGPPAGFSLLMGRLPRGFATTFSVTGAAPGDTILLAGSFSGIGPGPCFGTTCAGLLPPLSLWGIGLADGSGAFALRVTVPPTAPILGLHLQAARATGLAGMPFELSNTASSLVEF